MRLTKCFIVALALVIVGSCQFFPDNTVTIHGTVTITRNGIPWNTDNFPVPGNDRYNRNSRATEPPRNRPQILAYSASEDGSYIGAVYANEYQSAADLASGTYKWSMKIHPDKLPSLVYFRVQSRMGDINLYWYSHNNGPSKETEDIWIDDNKTVDLGIIDFKTLRLSGNLPVTINGEPLDYNYYSHAEMRVIHSYPWKKNTYLVGGDAETKISTNGTWFIDIYSPDTPQPLTFQVETRQDGGIFRKTLNPYDGIIVHDTDIEVIFPSYPNIDFKAFNLSGTIEVAAPGTGMYRFYDICFYREGAEPVDSGYVYGYDRDYKISEIDTRWSETGKKEWKTTIPALELPHELLYSFSFMNMPNTYFGRSSITITSDTDLSRINLGVFTFK